MADPNAGGSAPPFNFKQAISQMVQRNGSDLLLKVGRAPTVRVNGELRYVKVTPKYGLPYYLVPTGPGQAFHRYDSLGSGLRAPMWLLFSW